MNKSSRATPWQSAHVDQGVVELRGGGKLTTYISGDTGTQTSKKEYQCRGKILFDKKRRVAFTGVELPYIHAGAGANTTRLRAAGSQGRQMAARRFVWQTGSETQTDILQRCRSCSISRSFSPRSWLRPLHRQHHSGFSCERCGSVESVTDATSHFTSDTFRVCAVGATVGVGVAMDDLDIIKLRSPSIKHKLPFVPEPIRQRACGNVLFPSAQYTP